MSSVHVDVTVAPRTQGGVAVVFVQQSQGGKEASCEPCYLVDVWGNVRPIRSPEELPKTCDDEHARRFPNLVDDCPVFSKAHRLLVRGMRFCDALESLRQAFLDPEASCSDQDVAVNRLEKLLGDSETQCCLEHDAALAREVQAHRFLAPPRCWEMPHVGSLLSHWQRSLGFGQ